ncbi:carboxymuconolactone decarboxylase family protein [Lysobacter silvisoli]|uniref:Carboxymuconolactone decarboxylase family protein n=1 Tax=Lysobacter silvisoli TaxID=2293254 RepID=A0A371K0F1_9GAMM|nr:carboxymuconolactone decarboxylase family protein [Lysobacter silvisoli]RDZ27401.1 carboxymuconolactone decarboxylase family protein [Lysobacter silvisoli]
MSQRLDTNTLLPTGLKAMGALHAAVQDSGLDPGLIHLINVRASQINGCAYCLWLHTREALAHGDTPERLALLRVPDEGPFTERERAALAWTDAVTRIADAPVSDALYARVRAVYDEAELGALNYAVIMINAWNRLAIPFRKAPPIARD